MARARWDSGSIEPGTADVHRSIFMENESRSARHLHLMFALIISAVGACFVAINGNAVAYKLMSTLFFGCVLLMFFCAVDAYFRRDDLPL
jgi:hypothetical protein